VSLVDPFVSVVVPVLNREETVRACLESLLNLNYLEYEVIVVDGGSTDKTRKIIAEYPIKLLIDPRKGAYAARNTAVRTAQGEMIFFTDSDCIADRNVLRNLVRNFIDESVAGVGGQIASHNPTTVIERFSDIAGIVKVNYPKGPLKWNKSTLLSGGIYTANAMYSKRILEEIGGFDPEFVVGGDYEFAWRVQRAGYRLMFDPEAIVFHSHRNTLLELIKQFFNYGKEQAVKLEKQPESFFYIDVKTYVLPAYSLRFKSPFRAWITIDFFNLSILFLLLAAISPSLLYISFLFFLATILGAVREAWKVAEASKELRWIILYPFLHIVRHISWFAGKFLGTVKHRLLTF